MITYNTAALLFPAISLIMLAYTNRFLALASLVRALHAKYLEHNRRAVLKGQIANLRYRLKLVRHMQSLGILSFLACILCMYGIYAENVIVAEISFAISLLFFAMSLILSFLEVQLSNKALELELGDMEGPAGPAAGENLKK